MSKITAQPAKTFPKAPQAEKSSGEIVHRAKQPEGKAVRPLACISSIRNKNIHYAIGFNQHWDTPSLIRKEVACAHSSVFQAPLLRFILILNLSINVGVGRLCTPEKLPTS